MQTLKTKQQLSIFVGEQQSTLGFVPTMGALHDGHMSLIRYATDQCAKVIVSIFVNPLQFNEQNDFENYPETLDQDLLKLGDAEVDAVYLPRHRDIYPEDEQLQIMKAGAAAQNFEGAVRPGHFDGMLTVVHRLFNQVQPSHAFFGEKDAQQLCLVKQLVVDFDLPLEVVGCPLVRDKDGLALSSRNQRLSIGGRQRALAISRALNQCQADFAAGERRASTLIKGMTGLMQASQLDLQYCAIVDDCSFSEIDGDITSSSRAIIAAEVDSVHLIDNQSLDPNAC